MVLDGGDLDRTFAHVTFHALLTNRGAESRLSRQLLSLFEATPSQWPLYRKSTLSSFNHDDISL
jgi:hypothetical protein